ncbi:MAG TPA: hypothetical protein PKG95_11405, partial [Anaerolineaceae bacterium]|nr:hypothetical protein [Anaerolineaceae bacterium]
LSILAWGGGIFLAVRWRFRPRFSPVFWGVILTISVLLIVRLAFVADLFLPLYTDSVEHYIIIQDLVGGRVPPHSYYNLAAFPQVYYHYGYHSLMTRQIVMGGFEPARVMLILGQMYLVLAAVGLYFPVALLTHSQLAAFLTTLVAGVCWVMPAYAINWGKYPAIAAGTMLPFFMGMMAMMELMAIHLPSDDNRKKQPVGGLILLSFLGCTLTHSRMLVVILLLIMACLFSRLPGRRGRWMVIIIVGFCLLGVLGDASNLAEAEVGFELYWRYGAVPLVVALFGGLLCYVKYPRLAFQVLLVVALALGAMILPLPAALDKIQGLIDRPFFQIILFIPLSMLVGIGLAGLIAWPKQKYVRIPLALVLGIGLLVWSPLAETTKPSDCCQLVTPDDLFIYSWLDDQTLQTDRVLIAAYQGPYRLIESDGGAWVEALTLRSGEKALYTMDFDAPLQQKALCAGGIVYIYVGAQPYSFDSASLAAQPGFYKLIIQLPGGSLYQLNCGE